MIAPRKRKHAHHGAVFQSVAAAYLRTELVGDLRVLLRFKGLDLLPRCDDALLEFLDAVLLQCIAPVAKGVMKIVGNGSNASGVRGRGWRCEGIALSYGMWGEGSVRLQRNTYFQPRE